MPLPTVTPSDYTPTGISLSLSTYFNPEFNPYYQRHANEAARDGYISIPHIVQLAKTFSAPDVIEEVLHLIPGVPTDDTYTTNLYRSVYQLLPDDAKWLIFFSQISYVRETTNTIIYKVYIFYPTEADYNAFNRGFVELPIVFDRSTGSYIPQAPAFQQALTAHLPTALAGFAIDRLVIDNDGEIPQFIRQVVRYARNAAIFCPTGEREGFPVTWDWTTPSSIRDYQLAGYRVTLGLTPNCHKLTFKCALTAGDRRSVKRLLNYSANVLDFLPYTIKGPKEPKAVLYGVELEACGDYTVPELIDAQKDLFFICKQDGSIHGNKPNAYELVTVPSSLKAHKRLWAEFFEKVDYTAFDTSRDTGNGMHVHIDRKSFTQRHLNRFTWFITNPANTDFMLAISERPTKKNFEEWARLPNHFVFNSKIQASRGASITNSGIRGAVHFKRDKTVEVRMFKGIVSYATIVKNLEFVDSVFHYTQQTMLCQQSLKHYLSWLQNTPKNKYQMLKAFLSEIKTSDMVASAEVTEYIWKESRDHIVVEKLNKAPFTITNTHISALNKKRRKRTYILKSGKVLCVSPTGGLLAKLDQSVQKRQTRGAASFALTDYAA
jgi:hypothetical protein